jgi:hypothetical protein
MPKFIVLSKETVFYEAEVEASNAEEAMQKVHSGDIGCGHPESDDWHIYDVEELKL